MNLRAEKFRKECDKIIKKYNPYYMSKDRLCPTCGRCPTCGHKRDYPYSHYYYTGYFGASIGNDQ